MKVIAIEEANHGFIGLAQDIPSAIDFLVKPIGYMDLMFF